MISSRAAQLVKGAGFAKPGGYKPLEDEAEILDRGMKVEKAIRAASRRGASDPAGVFKALNPSFVQQFGLMYNQMPQNTAMQQFAAQLSSVLSSELGKNISLTSPLSSGLVPYDLLAPSRLIYPVFSPSH